MLFKVKNVDGSVVLDQVNFQDDEHNSDVLSYMLKKQVIPSNAKYTCKGSIKSGSVSVYKGKTLVAYMY